MKLLWICSIVLYTISCAVCADHTIVAKKANGKCQNPRGHSILYGNMSPHRNPGKPVNKLACKSLANSSTKKTIKAGAKVLQSTIDRIMHLVKDGINLSSELNTGVLNKAPRKQLNLTRMINRYRKDIQTAVSETYKAIREFAKDYGYGQLDVYTKIANALAKGRV